MINTKTCPRCHEILNTKAKFCSRCGWKFGSNRNNWTPRRRWKEKSFQNASFKEVMEWLKENNGRIEILNARGNLKYDTSGIFFISRDWYVQYLNIRYYDDQQANKNYGLVYSEKYDSLFSSGSYKASNECAARVNGRPVVYNIVRSSHYSGGESKQYSCAMSIFEI